MTVTTLTVSGSQYVRRQPLRTEMTPSIHSYPDAFIDVTYKHSTFIHYVHRPRTTIEYKQVEPLSSDNTVVTRENLLFIKF